MKFYRNMAAPLVLLTLAACSANNNTHVAKGDFDYASKDEPKYIEVPENLQKPVFSDHYKVTKDINMSGPIGQELDIRAPSLPLPLAAGSRVEQTEDGAQIWFDQVDDSTPLKSQLQKAIQDLFAEKSVEVSSDDGGNSYVTGWVNKYREKGFWLWSTNELVDKKKFKIGIISKPHGRSVSISTELLGYENDSADNYINSVDKSRAETAMTNEIVGQLSYQYRLNAYNRQQAITKEDMVTLGQSSDGDEAYIVQLPVDSLWDNMPSFFEKYGFTQTDLDESNRVYYVDYAKPETGFWDSVWGDALPTIELANGKYRFKLSLAGKNSTAVTIMNESGENLGKAKLSEIMTIMSDGLSFK